MQMFFPLGKACGVAGERKTSPLRRKFSQRLRAIEGDGALLAEQWAGTAEHYDAILIDAYDSLNRVPEPLWVETGPFARCLPDLLSARGVLAEPCHETSEMRPERGQCAAGLSHPTNAQELSAGLVHSCAWA